VLLLLALGMESAHTGGHARFRGGIASEKNEGFIRFLKVVRSFNGHDGTLERNGVINRVEELEGLFLEDAARPGWE
jgi:hypothetical protein